MSSKKKIAVLMGGDSGERAVSLSSGRAVAGAIDRSRYEVVCVAWNGALPSQKRGDELDGIPVFHVGSSQLLDTLMSLNSDLAFITLHGGSGENGNLQAMLEKVGLRYTGSGPVASALGMDKVASKQLFARLGLSTPKYLGLPKADIEELGIDQLRASTSAELGLPFVVKPVAAGSTLGVTIVRSPDQLRAAIDEALLYDTRVLIEEYIAGTELTAGVISESGQAIVFPLIEIVPKTASGFYDYEAKYTPGMSEHIIPPRLPAAVQQRVREAARTAYQALGCRGMARADFMVAREGTPYLLEVNTVPGMTATSLVPDSARSAGIDFPALVQRLIEDAMTT